MTYVLCGIENLVKVIFIDIIIVQNQILNFELQSLFLNNEFPNCNILFKPKVALKLI